MSKRVILLAAEDEVLRRSLRDLLLCQGCGVVESSERAGVRRSLQQGTMDLVVIAPRRDHPDEGVTLGAEIRRMNSGIPLILITEECSEALLVATFRAGMNDYVKYPCDPGELAAAIARCLSRLPSSDLATEARARAPGAVEGFPMIGESPPMREVRAYIGKVASTCSNVLITGETGTGKELVAELIHRNSPRHEGPFVCINCAALPDSLVESELFGHERGAFTGAHALREGRLKLADGGTAFLDEVGDMTPEGQAKILRVIESKEVHRLGGSGRISLDIRFIAATNQDLEKRVADGDFRKDLYFRLNVARIHLPPLRDRKEDIPALCAHYLRELNRQFGRNVEGFTDEASELLFRYEWPGNVRELRNLLEAAFINFPSRQITLADLPEQFRKRLTEPSALSQDERARLLSTLFSTNWNKSKAAQKLRWSRMTLYRKMAKYHLHDNGEGEQNGSGQ